MLPPLAALRCFDTASRSENFSVAADILCLTPSAVSHQIKLLEEFVGQQLFVRSQRRMQLTNAGMAYAKRIGPVFVEIEKATSALLQSPDCIRLVIQVAPSLASNWLVPRLADFIRRYPSIQIQILTDNGTSAPTPHCEIRYGHGKWPNAVSDILWIEKLRPMVSKDGPLLRTVEDLKRATLIHTKSRARGWKDFLRTYDLLGEGSESGLLFDRTGLALEAATAGLGVTLESPLLARRLLKLGILSAPLNGVDIDDEAYYFIVPPGEMSDEVAVFKSWLHEHLPQADIP